MAFEGKLLRPGAAIDDSELWPGEDWPVVPLVLECAGRDFKAPLQRLASGFGGKRRPTIHILWRYERQTHDWRELVRASSVDNEWIPHFSAIARFEIGRAQTKAPVEIAERALARCVEAMDKELKLLQGEELVLALGFLYEQVAARVVQLDKCA